MSTSAAQAALTTPSCLARKLKEWGKLRKCQATEEQECVWLQRFRDRAHAFRVVANWLHRYHTDRPHSALGYRTPSEYREQLAA